MFIAGLSKENGQIVLANPNSSKGFSEAFLKAR